MAAAVFIIAALLAALVVLAWRISRRLDSIDRAIRGERGFPRVTPGFEQAHQAKRPEPGPDTMGEFLAH